MKCRQVGGVRISPPLACPARQDAGQGWEQTVTPGFLVPTFEAEVLPWREFGAKKGGMNGLEKLRSGAKRNEAILAFLICGNTGLM
jgi:hypothetical protein